MRYKIYLADIRPLVQNEKLQKAVYDRLPLSRQHKADSCRFPKARAASLGAGFLMEYALKKQGLTQYQIDYADGGAPMVIRRSQLADAADGGRQMEIPVYISVSHSGDYAACVICDRPVGIDIQQDCKVKGNMLRHFLTSDRQQEFLQTYGEIQEDGFLNEPAQKAFLRQWAAKESYMKLTGEGMKLGFDHLILEEAPAGSCLCIRDQLNRYGLAKLKEYHVSDGYFLAVSVGEQENP